MKITRKQLVATSIGVSFVLVYIFFNIFSGRWILPQSFSLGPLIVHYYGFCMALAVATGYWLASKRAALYGLSEHESDVSIIWLVIGGFVGARFYHVLSSFSYYWQHPLDALKIWNGGLSIYGAVLGGAVVLFLVKKYKHMQQQFAVLLHWLTPAVLIGQIIGRFGNMFNYELYGYPTNVLWKMYVPPEFRLPGYQQFAYFHPLFLYEALGNSIIFFVLFAIEKANKNDNSTPLFFYYLLLYNILRFVLEFLRIDSTMVGGIRINAYVSLLLVFIAILFLIKHPHDKVPQNSFGYH